MAHKELSINDYEKAVGETGQLVDVREPDEVAQGTLPGAVNIPLGDLPNRMDELDRHRPVVLLCRSGGRSGQAAEMLSNAGFDEVVNLVGGMLHFDG